MPKLLQVVPAERVVVVFEQPAPTCEARVFQK
jgi:hypothetical protein